MPKKVKTKKVKTSLKNKITNIINIDTGKAKRTTRSRSGSAKEIQQARSRSEPSRTIVLTSNGTPSLFNSQPVRTSSPEHHGTAEAIKKIGERLTNLELSQKTSNSLISDALRARNGTLTPVTPINPHVPKVSVGVQSTPGPAYHSPAMVSIKSSRASQTRLETPGTTTTYVMSELKHVLKHIDPQTLKEMMLRAGISSTTIKRYTGEQGHAYIDRQGVDSLVGIYERLKSAGYFQSDESGTVMYPSTGKDIVDPEDTFLSPVKTGESKPRSELTDSNKKWLQSLNVEMGEYI